MIRLLFTLAITAGVVPLCGCLRSLSLDSTYCAFDIQVKESEGSSPGPIAYVVFEERRTIQRDIETAKSASLVSARIWSQNSGVLEYRVPPLAHRFLYDPLLPMASSWSVEEHRLTVFAPGYAAMTLFPVVPTYDFDASGHPVSVVRGKPGILGPGLGLGDAYGSCVTANSGYVEPAPNPRTRENGAVQATIVLQRSSVTADRKTTELFKYQLCALARAIKNGHLELADFKTRALLLDAMRQQHESLRDWMAKRTLMKDQCGLHSSTFEECVENKDSPCAVIWTWANMKT